MASSININQNNNGITLQDNNRSISVTDNNSGTTVNVTQPVTNVVTVSTPGPQGPIGPIPTSGAFTGSFSGSFTGSLQGTSSYATSASYALTASYAMNGGSGGGNFIATGSISASVSLGTGSFTVTSGSSTFMFVSSSGNVGIGTTTPAYKLDVVGDARVTSALYLGAGTNAVGFYSPTTNVLGGFTSGAEKFRVFSNGNFVIGNLTDAGYKLDVNGSLRATSGEFGAGQLALSSNMILGYNGIRLRGGASASTGGTSVGNLATPQANVQLYVLGYGTTSSTTSLLVQNSNTSASLAVLDNGYVGIGTSTPTVTLDVLGNESRFSTSTGALNLYFQPGVNQHNNFINTRQDSDFIFKQNVNGAVNTSTLLIKGNTGNVLINTTTDAGYKLDVSGSARIVSDALINGVTAGRGNSSINTNTAFGFQTLISNTTATSNTGVGFQSLATTTIGSNNTAIGSGAMRDNLSGTGNTALGVSSLLVSTGNNNTAIGYNAGNANTTGTNNIFIGFGAVGASITDSNRTWIGNSSTTSTWLAGNVLIGTTTDAGYKLDVNGTSRFVSSFRCEGQATFISAIIATAQVRIGSNPIAASSVLDVQSTTQGFLPPRMTLAQRTAISSPAVGLIVYETGSVTSEGLWLNETTGWQQLLTNSGSQSISGSLNVTSLTASNAIISGNVTVLGTASINTLIVNQTQLSTGSNQLGDAADDFQTLYGTVRIPTGSLTVSGALAVSSSQNSYFVGGGNVGIGTTSPSTTIDARGTIRATGVVSTARSIEMLYDESIGSIIRTNTYNLIHLLADTNKLATFQSTGILFPANSSQLVGNTNRNLIEVYNEGTGKLTAKTTGAWNLELGTNDIIRQTIVGSTGNILINTLTDAGYKLDVNGTTRIKGTGTTSATTAFTIQNSAGTNLLTVKDDATFTFAAGNTADFLGNVSLRGVVDSGNAANNLRFISAGPTKSVLINADYSNINAPSAMLEVQSTTKGFLPPRTNLTSNISSPAQGLITYLTGSTNEGLYYYNSGSTPGWRQVADTTFVSASLSGSAGYLPVFTGANSVSSSVIFQSGSNVGIGTTSPLHKLDVEGALRIVTTPSAGNIVRPDNIGAAFQFGNGVNTAYGEFRFKDGGGTDLAKLTSTGNLGIGTTSPTALLQVKGSGTTSATTSFRVENANASASMVVLDNGFVGINTGSAQYTLDVNGTISSGNLFRNNVGLTLSTTSNRAQLYQSPGVDLAYFDGSNVVNGLTLRNTGFVGIGPNLAPSASLHISGASSAALLRVDSPALNNILFVSGSGNVGIGTNTPSYALDVTSPTGATAARFFGAGGTATVAIGANGFLTSQAGQYRIYSAGAVPLTFGSYGTYGDLWVINGNVGVGQGTTVPTLTSKFTIRGAGATSSTTSLLVENSNTSSSLSVLDSGNVGIGTSTPGTQLEVRGSDTSFIKANAGVFDVGYNTSNRVSLTQNIVGFNSTMGPNGVGGIRIGNGSTYAYLSANGTSLLLNGGGGNVGIGTISPSSSLHVAGTTRLSGSFNTAVSGSILTVQGSGSAQPIFTVQGSQGELFSITDSLSGSLFSVNDISGLPILEVFSDNTTLIGNYQDPMLITTAKVVQTNSGSFTMYSLPTASYDTAFFEYSIRSGSNARAGTIMAIQSGSAVNFTETTTTDFGSTSAVSFTVVVTGSNMALTGSSTSGAWTIKTIVRGL